MGVQVVNEMSAHIKAKEAELRTTLIIAWAFSIGAAFSALGALTLLFLLNWRYSLDGVAFLVAVAMLLLFGYLAAAAWAAVRLSTRLLANLNQDEAKLLVSKQEGVWPPPPTAMR